MLGSAVALMDVEAVEGVLFVERNHFLVAEVLGDNGGETDRDFGCVTFDDGFLFGEIGRCFQSPIMTNVALAGRKLFSTNY